MALSDEVLKTPVRLSQIRRELTRALDETGAEAAFLLDEKGTPFATVGAIQFSLPDPVASHEELLSALVGENDGSSPYLVVRAAERALLVLVFDAPAVASEHREVMASVATAIRSQL